MNVQQIAQVLVNTKNFIPEAARSQLCFMFMRMVGDCIQETNDDLFENWREEGAKAFLATCKLECMPAVVAPDMRVKESLLSEFCNKWMHVTQFHGSDSEEWLPITADMNSLRVTMVEELKELADSA
jgi:hypothetical protein